jgi:hypothetical protein
MTHIYNSLFPNFKFIAKRHFVSHLIQLVQYFLFSFLYIPFRTLPFNYYNSSQQPHTVVSVLQ